MDSFFRRKIYEKAPYTTKLLFFQFVTQTLLLITTYFDVKKSTFRFSAKKTGAFNLIFRKLVKTLI